MLQVLGFFGVSNNILKTVAIFFSIILLSALSGAYQPAKAEENWVSILVKPLVDEVVMPVFKKQMDQWHVKLDGQPIGQQAPVITVPTAPVATPAPPISAPAASTSVTASAPASSASSSTSPSSPSDASYASAWEWKSPEEPMTTAP